MYSMQTWKVLATIKETHVVLLLKLLSDLETELVFNMAKFIKSSTANLTQPLLSMQILMALAMISTCMTSVLANAVTPEIPTVSDNENEFGDLMPLDGGFDEKRSGWQSLQGSWGKRSGQDNDLSDGDNDHILPVLISSMDPKSKIQVAYLTNAATLEHLANPQEFNGNSMEGADLDDGILNEKRAWKSMNVAWGKRRNGPTWNKFRGE